MNYKEVANEILKAIGGEKNVKFATHCMTRLRFVLKDESLADDSQVESISGVKGLMKKGGQYQVIIGGDVANVFSELPASICNTSDVSEDEKSSKQKSYKGYMTSIFDYVSGSLTAALPAIIGCGMVKLLLVILGMVGLDKTTTYSVLNIIGDAGFYFLPVIIAYTAAKKLNTDIVLSVVVSAVLIHPALIKAMTGDGLSFLGIPIYSTSYVSAVIPPLFVAWVLKYVVKVVDKITPGWTKAIFKPLLTLIITIPIVLTVFAPLGAIIGLGLVHVTETVQQFSPWLTMTVLSALMPLLIITGMHHAFDPIMFANFAGPGFDGLFLPMMLATNFALGSACLAVGLKTKDKNLKSIAFSSGISASIAGITEPGLFGVLLRLKRPLFGAMIGSGVAGLLVGIFNVKSYALASPGLIAMISFISPDKSSNFINATIVAAVATVISFIATLVIGFEDFKKEEKNDTLVKDKNILSPIKGKIIPIEEVNDATFAKKIIGDGIAIIPEEGKVYSPVDGTIQVMFKTGHAIGLLSDNGDEILIHVGLDTVKLDGEGFSPKVKDGDHVNAGDLLLEFDLSFLKNQGYDITTPIVITNMDTTNRNINNIISTNTNIDKLQPIIELKN